MTTATAKVPRIDEGEERRQAYRERLLAPLNEQQRIAVSMNEESALVLAGAGSGKTSVLTARIAYLMNEGFNPCAVLAVTFTNKAAEEMKQRLRKTIGREAVDKMWIGTFHSLCHKILRIEHEAANLPKSFAILDTDGQESLLRTIVRDAKRGRKATEAEAAAEEESSEDEFQEFKPAEVVGWINKQKEAGIRPENVAAENGSALAILQAHYMEYQKRCAQQGLLDFNDLLTRTVSLLESNTLIRNAYRTRFRSILVDEFQDTNEIQYRWLCLLKDENAFVMAVGDQDQSIYAFRGAKPENMVTFRDNMANGRVIKLEQNYRSLPYILDSANAVIRNNGDRIDKALWTSLTDRGERILTTEYSNGFFESRKTAEKIQTLVKDRRVAPNEIAVLYRTNSQSRLLEQELNKLNIPVTVYGGFRFYERQEVKHVLAYLDLVTSFDRDISFMRVINFPPRGIGERTVEDLRQEGKANNVSMIEMIVRRSESKDAAQGAVARKKQAALEQFAGIIFDLADAAQSMPLSKLIEAVMKASGLKEHYETNGSQEEAQNRMENLMELVSAAKQFELDHPDLVTAADILPEYMAFIQLMTSTSESDMEKKKTVSLMTVHSAKGLEFDNVFIVGLEENIFPHSRAIQAAELAGNGGSFEAAWAGTLSDMPEDTDSEDEASNQRWPDAPEIEEERRLMYVALTRARKSLEISFSNNRLVNGKEEAMLPSRFIRELPAGRVKLIRDEKNLMGTGRGFIPARPFSPSPVAPSAPAQALHQDDTAKVVPAPQAVLERINGLQRRSLFKR